MKKITLLFSMLLSITAFSQIEIVEDFNSTANLTLPTGWTSSAFLANDDANCDGNALYHVALLNGLSLPYVASATSPNYTAISNGTEVTASFSYNVYIQEQIGALPVPFSSMPTGWGSLDLEYSTDNGSNWTSITTITDNVPSDAGPGTPATCMSSGSISAGTIANGSDFQVRFSMTLTADLTPFNRVLVMFDDISIFQVTSNPPNCDAVLTSPLNGSSDAFPDTTMQWNTATGFPQGYDVTVGTASGLSDVVNETGITNVSLDLSTYGLSYSTQYFVNITPYNSNGSATGCTEESFTTRAEPGPGTSCSTAFDVIAGGNPGSIGDLGTTGLYIHNGDTSTSDNIYNTATPCTTSTAYLSGNDVVYEISPTSDMSIGLEFTNASGASKTQVGMYLLEGCMDASPTCIAYGDDYTFSDGETMAEDYNSPADDFSEIVLTGGTTYYLLITSKAGSELAYTLQITKNSCIDPAMTLTPTGDCGNDQFYVDVEVTSMGDATSVTLTDDYNGGNTYASSITATGTYQMGPYASNSTIGLGLVHDQDNTCFEEVNISTYFWCPETNDECADAIVLTPNTDDTCTLTTSGNNVGATPSGVTSTCTSDENNDVWFTFTATSENMFIEYSNIVSEVSQLGTSKNLTTALFSGSCGSLTEVLCTSTFHNNTTQTQYLELLGLTVNDTYYVRNTSRTTGAGQQSFDICLSNKPAVPANDECMDAIPLTLSTIDTCDNETSGTTAGSTNSVEGETSTACSYGDVWYTFTPPADGPYNFKGTDAVDNTHITIYEGTCDTSFTLIGGSSCSDDIPDAEAFILTGGVTYYISVGIDSGTIPGNDFTICVEQLPIPVVNNDCSGATALSESSDINGNNVISGSLDNTYYSPESCFGTTYEVVWHTFTPTLTGQYHTVFTAVSGSPRYTIFNTDDCSLTSSSNIVSGFGPSCYGNGNKTIDVVANTTYLIAVGASTSAGAAYELFIYPDETLSLGETVAFEGFKFFPNPVNNAFNVEARNVISNISVYNMLGQKVITTNPNTTNANIEMSHLNEGVYFVKTIINGAEKTIKVIKN